MTGSKIRSNLEKTIQLAEKAFKQGNYPIGSIVTDEEGKIIAAEFNQCTSQNDISAHAEILCIRKAGNTISWGAKGKPVLFSSLEPCFGCSFFLARTNIKKIYSALKDPHKGGISDLKAQKQFDNFFRDIEITNEPFVDLKEKSMELMKKYFLNIGKEKSANYYSEEK